MFLVRHIKDAPHTVLRLEKTGQTDRCETIALCFLLDAVGIIIV